MPVAFDAFSSSTVVTTADVSWTHTPVGTPKGVMVFFVQDGTSTDIVTGVTYGGTAMTEMSVSPVLHTTGETGGCYGYFLGANIPTGAQTVQVTNSDTGVGNEHQGLAVTLTADNDTEIIDVDSVNSDSVADPSVTLSLAARAAFACIGFVSGQNDPAGVTPLTSWTARVESDFGGVVGACYTYDTIGSTDVTAGWTQLAEDAIGVFVAVSELQSTLLGYPVSLLI